MKDTALAIEERLHWECRANGKPKPSYAWLKNGQQLLSGVNHSLSSATYQHFILKTKSAASAHLPRSFQHAARSCSLSLIFFPRRGFEGGGTNISVQMEAPLSRLFLGRLRSLREWISALAARLLSVIRTESAVAFHYSRRVFHAPPDLLTMSSTFRETRCTSDTESVEFLTRQLNEARPFGLCQISSPGEEKVAILLQPEAGHLEIRQEALKSQNKICARARSF